MIKKADLVAELRKASDDLIKVEQLVNNIDVPDLRAAITEVLATRKAA